MKVTAYILVPTSDGRVKASLVIEGEYEGSRAVGTLDSAKSFSTDEEAHKFARSAYGNSFINDFHWGKPRDLDMDLDTNHPWITRVASELATLYSSSEVERPIFRSILFNQPALK